MNRATRTLCRFLLACFLTGIMVFPVRSSAMTKPPKMAGLPIPFVEQPGQHIQFTARTLGGSFQISTRPATEPFTGREPVGFSTLFFWNTCKAP